MTDVLYMSTNDKKPQKLWCKNFPASVLDSFVRFTHQMKNLPTIVSAGQSEHEVVVSVRLPLWKEKVRHNPQICCQKGVRGGVSEVN